MDINPTLLSIDAAVARGGGGLSRSKIYAAIKSKELPAYKFGGRTVLKPDEFDSWLLSQLRDFSDGKAA